MFIYDYLIDKYGEDTVRNGGLNVVTTLDYSMQEKAEEIVKRYALQNEKNFDAENAALVAIDPKTGQILTMVGSRDYFDKKIDGQFNVATAIRQPGSTFKPFAYATAFKKGFTPETVLFDVKTQFSTTCDAYGKPKSPDASCYSPNNYDDKFFGPISMRYALAQSRNVPAIKTLYLAGLRDTLQTARDMGITSLGNINKYGLTLVFGGGEVSPLQMTSAYGVFAADGVRSPSTGILKVTDRNGKELESFTENKQQVIDSEVAEKINDVLSDNNARMSLNGPGSPLDFSGQQVALKTGTTNDYRDVWIIGYTPNIVVGSWAGNNSNRAMQKKTSGYILAPMWRAFMNEVLTKVDRESFVPPPPLDPNLKPILRGIWQGNKTYTVDKTTGKLATEFTPVENIEERALPNAHNILYWVDKNDPTGPAPTNPHSDPQYDLWEPPVAAWVLQNNDLVGSTSVPTQVDDIHTPDAIPQISIITPTPTQTFSADGQVTVTLSYSTKFPVTKAELYINNTLVDTQTNTPFTFTFRPQNISSIRTGERNNISVAVYDLHNNRGETQSTFEVR
jgi:membrane peptidoglycan carboxypeptidase